jgi:hypothetical protein
MIHSQFRLVPGGSLELIRRCIAVTCLGHCVCAAQGKRCSLNGNKCNDVTKGICSFFLFCLFLSLLMFFVLFYCNCFCFFYSCFYFVSFCIFVFFFLFGRGNFIRINYNSSLFFYIIIFQRCFSLAYVYIKINILYTSL